MRCENVAGAREDVAVAFQAQQKKPATQACGREIAALHGGKESLKMPRNLLLVEGNEEDEIRQESRKLLRTNIALEQALQHWETLTSTLAQQEPARIRRQDDVERQAPRRWRRKEARRRGRRSRIRLRVLLIRPGATLWPRHGAETG